MPMNIEKRLMKELGRIIPMAGSLTGIFSFDWWIQTTRETDIRCFSIWGTLFDYTG